MTWLIGREHCDRSGDGGRVTGVVTQMAEFVGGPRAPDTAEGIFPAGRVCANGDECVTVALCGAATILSIFNPGVLCYCCQRRAGVADVDRPVSTTELMTQVAA